MLRAPQSPATAIAASKSPSALATAVLVEKLKYETVCYLHGWLRQYLDNPISVRLKVERGISCGTASDLSSCEAPTSIKTSGSRGWGNQVCKITDKGIARNRINRRLATFGVRASGARRVGLSNKAYILRNE
jgi:hypothetical protein